MRSEQKSDSRLNSVFESVVNQQPVIPPTEPPEITEFKKLSKYEQSKNQDFWQTDKIKKYLDDKWNAQLHNRDAILWLCDYRDNHMQPDQEHAVTQKLRQFLAVIGNQQDIYPEDIYPALRLNLLKLGLIALIPRFPEQSTCWVD